MAADKLYEYVKVGACVLRSLDTGQHFDAILLAFPEADPETGRMQYRERYLTVPAAKSLLVSVNNVIDQLIAFKAEGGDPLTDEVYKSEKPTDEEPVLEDNASLEDYDEAFEDSWLDEEDIFEEDDDENDNYFDFDWNERN